jgi:hypothetical protein
LRAAGIIGLAVANLPEDWRDIKAGYNQVFKDIKPDYDYKNYQHRFSFFRGTFLEPVLKLKSRFGERLGGFLNEADKTLDDTKFGKFLSKIFKFQIDYENTNLIKRIEKNGEVRFIQSYQIDGKFLSRLIGRSLLRIPVLSVIILGLLEVPKIIGATLNKENAKNKFNAGLKQLTKSAIYVSSVISSIGCFGALLARFGPAGSLIGMGIGSVVGSNISQKMNNLIDHKKD